MEINILFEITNRLPKIASKSHFSGQDSCHSVPREYRLSIVLVDFYNNIVVAIVIIVYNYDLHLYYVIIVAYPFVNRFRNIYICEIMIVVVIVTFVFWCRFECPRRSRTG